MRKITRHSDRITESGLAKKAGPDDADNGSSGLYVNDIVDAPVAEETWGGEYKPFRGWTNWETYTAYTWLTTRAFEQTMAADGVEGLMRIAEQLARPDATDLIEALQSNKVNWNEIWQMIRDVQIEEMQNPPDQNEDLY